MTHNDKGAGGDLRTRRLALGISQEKLGRRADCATVTVALYERGYRPGRSMVLDRIESALDAAEQEQRGGP